MTGGTYRFPRDNRLTRPSEYKEVFNHACRVADRQLLVLAAPNRLGRARLGLAISRKRIRSAVARNRVKRLIRESFRCRKEALSGYDIVVLAQRHIDYGNGSLITQSLAMLWDKIARCE